MEYKKITNQDFLRNKNEILNQINLILETPENFAERIKSHYEEMFGSDKTYMLVAYKNSLPVAYAFVRYYAETEQNCIMDVNTNKNFQNQHIATNLLNHLISDFFKHNKDELYLWVKPENVIAKKIYEKLGFKTIKNIPTKLPFFKNIKDCDFYKCTINSFTPLGAQTKIKNQQK